MNFTKLKKFLDYMASERTPGCSVTVYKDGKLVYTYSAGVSDLNTGKKMVGDEYFNIYSCSKVTLATAAAQLIEKGIIMVNDPLYDYLPEYRHMAVKREDGNIDEAKNPITIGDLLSMTAGFNYGFNQPPIDDVITMTDGVCNTDIFARQASKLVLDYEPGTKWKYSMSHDIMGGVISIITGKKYRDYVRENIFEPLDMNNTFFHSTPEILDKMAPMYVFENDIINIETMDIVKAQQLGKGNIGHFREVSKINDSFFSNRAEFDSAGGGIISTVNDYAKLAAALSSGGLGANNNRILSPHAVELMKTNRLNCEQIKNYNWSNLIGYGYGLGVRTHIDKAKSGSIANLGEFGWGGAAGASIIMDTNERLGVFFVQHTLNPREEWYQPRLINIAYACLND